MFISFFFGISFGSVLTQQSSLFQESIRNSADNVLLSTPDSLVVSVSKSLGSSEDEQGSPSVSVSTPRKGRGQSSGMDVLDSLKFTYKACPLDYVALVFSFLSA